MIEKLQAENEAMQAEIAERHGREDYTPDILRRAYEIPRAPDDFDVEACVADQEWQRERMVRKSFAHRPKMRRSRWLLSRQCLATSPTRFSGSLPAI